MFVCTAGFRGSVTTVCCALFHCLVLKLRGLVQILFVVLFSFLEFNLSIENFFFIFGLYGNYCAIFFLSLVCMVIAV